MHRNKINLWPADMLLFASVKRTHNCLLSGEIVMENTPFRALKSSNSWITFQEWAGNTFLEAGIKLVN